MTIGGHVSIAGGIALAPERAAAIGANALQMFSGSPRGWSLPKVSEAEATAYREAARKHGIKAAYFHASYLINLADDGFIGDRSVDTLVAELKVAEALGVRGSIIHLGSFKEAKKNQKSKIKNQNLFETSISAANVGTPLVMEGGPPAYEKHPKYDLLIKNIETVLQNTPASSLFIIEGMGTRKIGRTLEEIGAIISDVRGVSKVNGQRLKVCMDTCHLHAAGYDLSTPKTLDEFLNEFDALIGLERLEVIHINDSRDEFGSLRDRHDNIGEGKIGKNVFKLLLNHPKTKHLPFLLEVPGFDDQGPDRKNVDILKSFVT